MSRNQISLHPDQPVLFVPVSGPTGAGEYYRCLAIACKLAELAPEIPIHFVLCRKAAVATDDRFYYHYLDSSPTYATPLILEILTRVRPIAVVFDSSLRAAQLKAARASGALVIGMVSRSRKRRRLLGPYRRGYLDEAWIVGMPERARSLSWWERLAGWGWPGEVVFAGAVTPPAANQILARLGIDREYALFTPGGGGGVIEGVPAASWFAAGALEFVRRLDKPAVLVSGPLYEGELPAHTLVSSLRSVEPAEMTALISNARVCVLGGGSILWQALSLKALCVAAPAGGRDQPARIAELERNRLILAARGADSATLAGLAVKLWSDFGLRRRMSSQLAANPIENSAGTLAERLILLMNSRKTSFFG